MLASLPELPIPGFGAVARLLRRAPQGTLDPADSSNTQLTIPNLAEPSLTSGYCPGADSTHSGNLKRASQPRKS